MTTKTKFILTFVAGIITGIIMLFALGYIISSRICGDIDDVDRTSAKEAYWQPAWLYTYIWITVHCSHNAFRN